MSARTCLVALALTLAATLARAAPMAIGVLPAADSIVLEVAAAEGFFAREGLDVRTVPFRSALEISAAMRAGRLQGHFGDLINVLAQNATGAPQRVVVTTTHTSPGQRCFALLVSPRHKDRLRGLSDLSATPTAMSSATIIDYLLHRLRQERGLPADALTATEIRQIPLRLQTLMSGQVATALLPEPLVSVALSGGAAAIWDDTGLDEPLAMVALRRELTDPATVAAWRRAIAAAAAEIERRPERYRQLMVSRRLLPESVAADYQMVRFSLFGRPDGLPPPPGAADVRRVGEWMRDHGMLSEVPDWRDVVAP